MSGSKTNFEAIYGIGRPRNLQDALDEIEEKDDRQDDESKPLERDWSNTPSAYVQAFEDAVMDVYNSEQHLLTEAEWRTLWLFSELEYKARYVLVRLLFRKEQWHTIASMEKYEREVGTTGISSAIRELCSPFALGFRREEFEVKDEEGELATKPPKTEGPDIIDLTLDSDDEDEATKPSPGAPTPDSSRRQPAWMNENAVAGPSRLSPTPTPSPADSDVKPNIFGETAPDVVIDYFCINEKHMDIGEVLEKLSVEQLKELVKSTKTRCSSIRKRDMIDKLIYNARCQSVLPFPPTPQNGKGKKKANDGLTQTTLQFSIRQPSKARKAAASQEEHLKQLALKALGPCVRVHHELYRLLRRLNIVYYRSPETPTSFFLPSLLSRFKKRTYALYSHARTGDIWVTREEFLRYEEALELEAEIEKETDAIKNTPIARTTATPAIPDSRFVTPAVPMERNMTTPVKTPRMEMGARSHTFPRSVRKEHQFATPVTPALRTPRMDTSASAGPKTANARGSAKKDEDALELADDADEEVGQAAIIPLTLAAQKAAVIRRYYKDTIRPRWEYFVALKKEEVKKDEGGESSRGPGLDRFEPGHVYTRLLEKCCTGLGPLKEYTLELEILEVLLSQRFWRRGKRGKLYERRALVQTKYLCDKDEDPAVLRKKRQKALDGLYEALQDDDTRLVYRPSLVRRVMALEKQLKKPSEDRLECERELQKAHVVQVIAEKIDTRSASVKLDANLKVISGGKENNGVLPYQPVNGAAPPAAAEIEPETKKSKGKTKWVGKDGEEVSVEIRALEYYESLGFKGFHSETRILTTIFALLFWDIIFADVPGAFETQFQAAPLDMMEDSFYFAREDLITTRLTDIKAGKAKDILERHDNMYRPKDTWCIGVRWDLCPQSDLIEIVECMGGESLSIICLLFCEDYAGRCSGVPDLIVWDPKSRVCKFVEVKSYNDTAQENQKLWFDTLLRAGTPVDVCNVWTQVESDTKAAKSKTKAVKGTAKAKGRRASKAKIEPEVMSGAESEDEDDVLPQPQGEDAEEDGDYEPRVVLGTKRPHIVMEDELPPSPTPPAPTPQLPGAWPSTNRAEVLLTPRKRRKLAVQNTT